MSVKRYHYVYHLPYEERRKLCTILDNADLWMELALKHMQYDEDDIGDLKREVIKGNSPTSELLTMWGQQNHTILELFVLLHRMELHHGMALLKNFVEPKYHKLLKENYARPVVGDPKISSQNFNKETKFMEAKQHLAENNCTNSNNEITHDRVEVAKVAKTVDESPSQTLAAYVIESAGSIPQIPYEDLEIATDKWRSSNILGQGGFGIVFKGTWKFTQVAIKRLETKMSTKKDLMEQIKQSITELHCLNAYRHDNILPVYGYSIGGAFPCLIYQYMSGGSLDNRILTKDKSKILSWPKRLNIAIGTARGLQFLHTTLHKNKPLVHGDIKSANILLDPTDQPRIGDFGLAREGPEWERTHMIVSRVQGTRPYLPDEFLRNYIFSTKVDTYSFGIVLFELATALNASDKRVKSLKEHILNHQKDRILELKDAKQPGHDFIFLELVRIGILCIQERARDRPQMVQTLSLLEQLSELNKQKT